MDKSIQTDPIPPDLFLHRLQSDSSYFTIRLRRWPVYIVSLCLALVGLAVCVFMVWDSMQPRFMVHQQLMEDIGVDGVIMFRQHDRNADGVLDLMEFEPLAHRLREVNVCTKAYL